MIRLIAIIAVICSISACATTNTSMYTPSNPTYAVDGEMVKPPLINYFGSDPQKIRFNVTFDKPVEKVVQEKMEQELSIRGFQLANDAPINLDVKVFSLVFPKSNATITAFNSESKQSITKTFDFRVTFRGETKVKSIYDAEGIMNHLKVILRDFLESEDFKSLINGKTKNGNLEQDTTLTQPNIVTKATLGLTKGSGVQFTSEESDPDEQAVKDAWLKRGGLLIGTEFGFGVSGFSQETNLSTGGVTSEFSSDGTGYLLRGGLNFTMLKPPSYNDGKLGNWSAFYYGAVLDFSYMDVSISGTTRIPGQPTQFFTSSVTQQNLNLSFPVGAKFGIGSGKDSFTWKGLSIGANWRPSIQWVIPEDPEAEVMQSTNMSGFGFDIDFGKMTTSIGKVAPDPFTRISLIFLPPIDDMPAFFSFTIARIMY